MTEVSGAVVAPQEAGASWGTGTPQPQGPQSSGSSQDAAAVFERLKRRRQAAARARPALIIGSLRVGTVLSRW